MIYLCCISGTVRLRQVRGIGSQRHAGAHRLQIDKALSQCKFIHTLWHWDTHAHTCTYTHKDVSSDLFVCSVVIPLSSDHVCAVCPTWVDVGHTYNETGTDRFTFNVTFGPEKKDKERGGGHSMDCGSLSLPLSRSLSLLRSWPGYIKASRCNSLRWVRLTCRDSRQLLWLMKTWRTLILHNLNRTRCNLSRKSWPSCSSLRNQRFLSETEFVGCWKVVRLLRQKPVKMQTKDFIIQRKAAVALGIVLLMLAQQVSKYKWFIMVHASEKI